MKTLSSFLFLFGIAAFAQTLAAAEIYVAPDGKDSNPGTAAAPLQTFAAAQKLAQPFAGKEPATVRFADGIYYLPDSVVFGVKDSGSKTAPVIYQAQNEGGAILSGGSRLQLKWEPYRDGIWKAATPAGLKLDQLFINGKVQHMARYPNFNPAASTDAYQGFAPDAFSKERAARWADPAGGFMHVMHAMRWGGYEYLITGKDPNGELLYEGGTQNNRKGEMHKDFRMVENIFEELDAPGEWFHDAKKNMLYYMPEKGVDLGKAVVEGVRLSNLIRFEGSQKAPVRWIELRGFTFCHAARTFMQTREPLLRSDWAIFRGGALLFDGAEDCTVTDCTFDQLGGNAIFVNDYNRRLVFRGLHITDIGASGIAFVGNPDAVRNPLFNYSERQDFAAIDLTPGPKSDDYPAECLVDDCLIHRIGTVEKQGAGVEISMARDITVRHCSIYDTSRAGINIGDGTWGGHLIEYCDVFDTVLETSDHGSFNSWGRDRFWGLKEVPKGKLPELALLDAVKPTTIRNSRWRCDHGWDIDLDDGSSNYVITNNVMLSGGLKLREGFFRKATNNILVNSGLHPHVWYRDSGDVFTGNIVMRAHKPVGLKGHGKEVDRNLFTSPADQQKFASIGWDKHSIAGDPMFVDPAKGDFRVKEGSPAFKIGFVNFPMDQFGVRKPALKKIARTPKIPAITKSKPQAEPADVRWSWMGATIKNLSGQEFSAVGVDSGSAGVFVPEVPEGSAAAVAGFRSGDFIESANGEGISSVAQFRKRLRKAREPLSLKIIRNQSPDELTIKPPFQQPAKLR